MDKWKFIEKYFKRVNSSTEEVRDANMIYSRKMFEPIIVFCWKLITYDKCVDI